MFKRNANETKVTKEERRIEKYKEKYNLNSLSEDDLKIVQNIATDMAGSGLMKTGMSLSFAKAEEQLKVGYLSTLVEQNWLIINQLNRLLDKLDD